MSYSLPFFLLLAPKLLISFLASFGYCAECFFGGGYAEKQVVDGGYERGEFSFIFYFCEDAVGFPFGFDG